MIKNIWRRNWKKYSLPVIHWLIIASLVLSFMSGLSPKSQPGSAASPTPLMDDGGFIEPTGPFAAIMPFHDEGPVGHTFIQEVWLKNMPDIYGAEVHIKFNPSVLQVVDADTGTDGIQISNGSLLAPSDPEAIINSADNTAGQITWAATLLDPQPPVSGAGTIATIEFQAIAPGWSMVGFSNPDASSMSDAPNRMVQVLARHFSGCKGPLPSRATVNPACRSSRLRDRGVK